MRKLLLILSAVLLLTGCAPAGAATDINGLLTGNGDEVGELPFDGDASAYLDGSGSFTAPITYPGNETQYLDGTGNFTTVSALRWKGVWTAPDWWDYDWQYQTPVSFNHTAILEEMTDFPALVLLDESFDFSHARADGFDLRFIDADGVTELSYERVSHDAENEFAEYYLKIPSIPAETNYTISCYYGNPTAADGQTAADVWSNGYAAVYHMNDLTTSTIKDSTANENTGTKAGANEPAETAGLVGEAQSFDGINDNIQRTTTPSIEINGQGLTLEAYNREDSTGSQKNIIRKSSSDYRVWAMQYASNHRSYGIIKTSDGYKTIYSSNTFTSGEWYYLVFTYDGSFLNLYADGAVSAVPVAHTGDIATHGWPLGLGNGDPYSGAFQGLIDEVRISSVARTAEWIAATNLHLQGDALAIGTETALEYAGYSVNDIVNYGNALYYCKQATTGLDTAPDTNTDDWELMLTGVAP